MRLIAVSILASLAFGGEAIAAESPFDKLLGPDAPACVPLDEFKKVGAQIITLTPDQFQFVRALFVAIPPISLELPAGNKAVEIRSGRDAVLAIVDGIQTCARFNAPSFILDMLDDVATGTAPKLGRPL